MTQGEVCEMLIKRGCKEFKHPTQNQVRSFGYKRVDGPDCTCNERPPQLHVFVYEDLRDPMGKSWPGTVTFSLVAEAQGTWIDLEFYSIPREETEEMLDIAYDAMSNMWIAGYKDISDGRERVGLLEEEDEPEEG